MSGYRETSFDPNSYPRYGKPLRPYNWVQWTGVALVLLGIGIDLVYFAGRLGWVRAMNSPTYALAPLFLGISLVNSRREILDDPAPELAAARKRGLMIVTAICVVVLGAAAAIDLLRS
jgi:hypothetical protein